MLAKLKRRVAILLLALLAFTQMNAALATCAMGSMSMAPMAGMADKPCSGCDTPLTAPRDQISSVCATHCATADQPSGVSAAFSTSSVQQPVLVLPRMVLHARPTGLDGPPSGAPPRRILLHSFLI